MISIGLVMGFGFGLMYCPAIVIVTMFFEKKRFAVKDLLIQLFLNMWSYQRTVYSVWYLLLLCSVR